MSQFYDNDTYIQAVKAAPPPPYDIETVAKDQEYMSLFHRYVEDQQPDAATSGYLLALTNLLEGKSVQDVWALTGSDLAMIKAPWGADVVTSVEMPRVSEDEVKEKMRREAVEYVRDWYPKFVEFVKDQQFSVSAPEAVELTPDKIDRAMLQSWNEALLKKIDEGDFVHFYLVDNLLLLSEHTDSDPYLNWFMDYPGKKSGTVEMTAKGKFVDPGKLTVKGDWDSRIADIIHEFSKKKVVQGR